MTKMRPSMLFFLLCASLCLIPSLLLASVGGGHEMTMSEILWDMGIKVLNVSILGFFAFKFLSKPLNGYVESRSQKVLQELESAKAGRREAEERLRSFQEKASKLDAEIEDLRKQTCKEIDKEQKMLFEEARVAAEHIRQHAKDTIRQEIAKARAELHAEAAMLSTKLAEEIIKKNINPDDHDHLVGGYLKEMEAAK